MTRRAPSRPLTPCLVGVAAALGLAATGCGGGPSDATSAGDIPDTQAFVVFTPAAGRYQIEAPEGWARTDATDGVAFSDKLNRVSVTLAARPSPPTVESGRAELAGIAASTPGYRPGAVSAVPRSAGTAVLLTYGADAEPDPVTGKVVADDIERYEFWKDGTLAVVALAAPHGADNVDAWRRITNSFRWLP